MLRALGVESTDTLEAVADYGVMLLLLTIGLKLRLKSLARPHVWASATLHMLITVVVFGLGVGMEV